MSIAQNVLSQVLIMFILIAVGFLCYKIKLLNDNVTTQMSNLLLLVVSPCIIVKAFIIDYNADLVRGLIISASLAVVFHVVGIIIGKIVIRKNGNPQFAVERFAVVYSNCGFMAIPLINAVLGDQGVFYASCFIAVFNIFVWTHGVSLMNSSQGKVSIKKILLSPNIFALAIGLVLFFLSIKLPSILYSPIEYISSMNTPLAMIITGIYIAKSDIVAAFKNKRIYLICFLRLLIVPLIMCVIYMFFDKNNPSIAVIVTANILAAGCPTAASCIMMSSIYGSDAEYASQIVTATTIFSIITLPVILWFMTATIGILR